jgi:hypothetical protein
MIRVGIAGFKGVNSLKGLGLMSDAYDATKDNVLVAHYRTMPIALMLARPMLWVHGLAVNMVPNRVDRARGIEALFNYSLGWGPAVPRLPQGCLFQIDQENDRMEAIANSLGGIEEENARIFRLDL